MARLVELHLPGPVVLKGQSITAGMSPLPVATAEYQIV